LLSEECAEVIQAVGKILRHGFNGRHPKGGPNNREQLETELGQVRFAEQLLRDSKDVRGPAIHASHKHKRRTIGPYLHHNTV
jgi:hypothetical protein